jgi:HMG (high mobility group) box
MNDKRPAMMKERPDLKFGGVTKQLTDDWNKMDDAAKAKYDEMAAKDKARY